MAERSAPGTTAVAMIIPVDIRKDSTMPGEFQVDFGILVLLSNDLIISSGVSLENSLTSGETAVTDIFPYRHSHLEEEEEEDLMWDQPQRPSRHRLVPRVTTSTKR